MFVYIWFRAEVTDRSTAAQIQTQMPSFPDLDLYEDCSILTGLGAQLPLNPVACIWNNHMRCCSANRTHREQTREERMDSQKWVSEKT